jgi:hypothetical protein
MFSFFLVLFYFITEYTSLSGSDSHSPALYSLRTTLHTTVVHQVYSPLRDSPWKLVSRLSFSIHAKQPQHPRRIRQVINHIWRNMRTCFHILAGWIYFFCPNSPVVANLSLPSTPYGIGRYLLRSTPGAESPFFWSWITPPLSPCTACRSLHLRERQSPTKSRVE